MKNITKEVVGSKSLNDLALEECRLEISIAKAKLLLSELKDTRVTCGSQMAKIIDKEIYKTNNKIDKLKVKLEKIKIKMLIVRCTEGMIFGNEYHKLREEYEYLNNLNVDKNLDLESKTLKSLKTKRFNLLKNLI